MTNPEVKAVKKVSSICHSLKGGEISLDGAAAQILEIGPLALNPLLSAAPGLLYCGIDSFELLDRLGGKPAVAKALRDLLDVASESYYDSLLGCEPAALMSFVGHFYHIGSSAVPALLEEMCGKHCIFAVPILVKIGHGRDAQQFAREKLRQAGPDRIFWMNRLIELASLVAAREEKAGLSPVGLDLNGLKLERIFQKPRAGAQQGIDLPLRAVRQLK